MRKLLLVLFILISGCKKDQFLTIGFVPSAETENIASETKPLSDILSKKLGIKVKTFLATDYSALISALGSKKIDIAFLPPFAYVQSKNKYNVEVIVKAIRQGKAFYRGQFVVRNNEAKNLEDLKGKIWAYPDASSTSGYLFPKAYMIKKGIKPDEFFKDKIQTGSHDNAILAVYNGQADLATTFEGAENRLIKEYPDIKSKLSVIGYTDYIPNDGIVINADLPKDIKAKIKETFLNLNNDKEALRILKQIYAWDSIVPAVDEDYHSVVEVMKLLGLK
jgi:phosphonate transport system substrate-binding protein